MDDLQPLILGYLNAQVLAFMVLPISQIFFGRLPDRGYCFSKTLGVWLAGVLTWAVGAYGFWPLGTGLAWVSVAALGLFSWLILPWFESRKVPSLSGLGGRLREAVSARHVRFAEGVFLLAYLSVATLRLFDPAVNHTEQPMDLMMTVAVWGTTGVPPQDPWLAGYPIGYYYFGYWLLANLAHLTGQLPEIVYNVGQALWFGLLAIGVFGLGFNLQTLRTDLPPQGREGKSLWVGVACAVGVCLVGNLFSVLQWVSAQGRLAASLIASMGIEGAVEGAGAGRWFVGTDWWWWSSSRVFQDFDLFGSRIEVISEFPSFSYLLGDLHPHVLAMPFVILVLAFGLDILIRGSEGGESWPPQRIVSHTEALSALAPGVFLGSLFVLNTWDSAIYFGFFLVCVMLAQPPGLRRFDLLKVAARSCIFLLSSSALLFWPGVLAMQSQAKGIAVNLFHPTDPVELFLTFGPFLIALLSFVWGLGRSGTRNRRLLRAGMIGSVTVIVLLAIGASGVWWSAGARFWYPKLVPEVNLEYLGIAFSRWLRAPLSLLGLGFLAGIHVSLLRRGNFSAANPSLRFTLLLATFGLICLIGPQLAYVRDLFESRMNTVFKFSYQAWLLLGVSGILAIAGSRNFPHRGSRILAFGSAVLVFSGLVFAPTAGYSKAVANFRGELSLDALRDLRLFSPDEFAAIQWVRGNTMPGDVILEAPGASYDARTSRISGVTGRPTLLGWTGHEMQWRGTAFERMASGRQAAAEAIYVSADLRLIAEILDQWKIRYVYLGPQERRLFPVDSEEQRGIRRLMKPVFASGAVEILGRDGW